MDRTRTTRAPQDFAEVASMAPDSAPEDVPITVCSLDALPDLVAPAYDGDIPGGDDDGGFDASCKTACVSPTPDPYPPPTGAGVCETQVPWCGAAACGNGLRDTCQSCLGGCAPSAIVEACDGLDLGGLSCADLGYAGGTLACKTNCSFDTSGCSTCVPDGCRVLACGPTAALGVELPEHLAVAASDGEIAALWTAAVGLGQRRQAYFARFSWTLEKLSQTAVGTVDTTSVALAPAPHGWTLATGSDTGLDVWSVGADGQVGTTPVHWDEPIAQIALAVGAAGATLVARNVNSNKEPAVRTSVLSPGGGSSTPTTTFMSNESYEAPMLATVSDGFLVAAIFDGDVTVVHLAFDGTPDSGPQVVVKGSAENPRLGETSDGARLVFGDIAMRAVRWLALDHTGKPVGLPVTIAGWELYNWSSVVGFGDDTVVLFAASGPPGLGGAAKRLQLARYDARGAARGPAAAVMNDPKSSALWALATNGSQIVAAWVPGGCPTSLDLARIAP